MAYTGDWSTLDVDKVWDAWESQDTSARDPGGAVLQTPNGRMEGGEFGKYSGIKQNPDGTYNVVRLRDNKTSDNDYQSSNYRLETGADGKQRFVQISDWVDVNRNSGWEKNLKAAAGMGAVMLGGAAMGGAFGGAGSGLLGGGIEATVGGLEAGAGAGGYGAMAGGAGAGTAAGSAVTAGGILDTVGGLEVGAGAGGAGAAVAGGETLASLLAKGVPYGQAIAALAGAAAGIADSGDDTTTRQSKMDPRMDPYVYGDGGVLSEAQKLYNEKKGGNPLVKQGTQMTADYYTSPEFHEEQKKRRAIGMGLLSGGVAANPFTTGEATLSPSNGLLTPYMQTGLFAQPKKKMPTPTSGTRG